VMKLIYILEKVITIVEPIFTKPIFALLRLKRTLATNFMETRQAVKSLALGNKQKEGYSDGQTDGCYERPTIPEHAECNSIIL
jgi:hypothetical protein